MNSFQERVRMHRRYQLSGQDVAREEESVRMNTARLLVFALVALQLIVRPAVAHAQCVIVEKPEDLFARADVVFEGSVVRTEATGAKGNHVVVENATLRVEKSWKGSLGREVRVGTSDRPFEIGKKYLVFAAR